MFDEINYQFYWSFIAPVLRAVFAFFENCFPNYFLPLYDVIEFSGRRYGKMTLLSRQVYQYKFSEQFRQKPEKKLVSEYYHQSYNGGE